MPVKSPSLLLLLFVLVRAACAQPAVDADRLLADVRYLSSDSLAGRGVGTAGAAAARAFVRDRFASLGVRPAGDDYLQRFSFEDARSGRTYEGANVAGLVRGRERPDSFIVLTAHYDHLGVRDGQVFNGADDNASGTAALLAAAAYFTAHPPRHSILLVALDAEERGLRGARAFLADPPVAPERLLLNVNMDMISRNEQDELYAAGTYHYPFLRPYLERAGARHAINLRFGHDSPDLGPGDDWTSASDHGVFHRAGIPFVYFGVEDHADYHRPTDDFERIDPDFYVSAVELILDAVAHLDAHLAEITAHPGG